jgi:hypothetical protein
MESFDVPVMALRDGDRLKVGMERYEQVREIDHRTPGIVKVVVTSGLVYEYGYRDAVTVASHLPRRPRATHRLGAVR